MDLINEETLEAKWCFDSETGEQYLIETKTGQVLLRKTVDGTIEEYKYGV